MNKVKKNFIYNIIYHVVSLIIPFIVNPYITRIISQELLGRNAYICAQISYLCLLGTLGMNYLGTREIAKAAADSIESVRERFYSLFHLQIANYVVVMVIYAVYLFLFPTYRSIRLLYILMILSSMTDINWLFMGLEEFKFISIRNCLIRIICTALVFLLVKNENDIELYITCLYLPQLLLNALMWRFAIKKIGKDSFRYVIRKEDVKSNLVLAIPGIAVSVYTILDKLVIGLFQPAEDVAIYDQGQSLVRIVLSAVAAFGTVVMPRISGMINKTAEGEKNKVLVRCAEFTWFLSSALTFGLIGVAATFINWYLPPNYGYVAKVIIYTAPIILIASAENVLGVQILVSHGGEKGYSTSLIAAAIVNLCLDLIFVPRYGIIAACICSVIAEGTALAIQCMYARKYVSLRDILKSSVFYLVSGAVMYLVLILLDNKMQFPSQIKTLLMVCIGGGVYLAICCAMRRLKGFRLR